jgi:hypothetical protein
MGHVDVGGKGRSDLSGGITNMAMLGMAIRFVRSLPSHDSWRW